MCDSIPSVLAGVMLEDLWLFHSAVAVNFLLAERPCNGFGLERVQAWLRETAPSLLPA